MPADEEVIGIEEEFESRCTHFFIARKSPLGWELSPVSFLALRHVNLISHMAPILAQLCSP